MSDFTPYAGGWINLNHVTDVWPDEEGKVVAVWATGETTTLEGDDARAILAKLRSGHSTGGVVPSYPPDAQKQAQELAKTLGGNSGRRFDFVDSQGVLHDAVTYREGESWVAVVDGVRGEPQKSEPAAMSAAMRAA